MIVAMNFQRKRRFISRKPTRQIIEIKPDDRKLASFGRIASS